MIFPLRFSKLSATDALAEAPLFGPLAEVTSNFSVNSYTGRVMVNWVLAVPTIDFEYTDVDMFYSEIPITTHSGQGDQISQDLRGEGRTCFL